MGYSGYTQYLCAKGHELNIECGEDKNQGCAHCGSRVVWFNVVDTTNGSLHELVWTDEEWDSMPETASQEEWYALLHCSGCEECDGGRIDGYVELEMSHPPRTQTCGCCSHVRQIEPARYIIPTNKGRRL